MHAEYPPRDVSTALSRQNLWFLRHNGRFGFATAAVYTLLSWLLPHTPAEHLAPGVGPTIMQGLALAVGQPSAIALMVLLLVAVVYFTDSNWLSYRVAGGLVHGLAHLLAALGATVLGLLAIAEFHVTNTFARWLVLLVATVVLGYVFGAVIMGVYLYVSVRVFRRHGNEAFSSLRIEGFKNLVRMRVDARGISLWAFGIDRMPARWTDAPWPLPTDDDAAATPRVIDTFTIPAPAARTGEVAAR